MTEPGNKRIARTTQLRQILAAGGPGIVPGATDCFTARLIEQAGFPVVYVTGGGTANAYLGAPDIGLVTLNELASQVERIADAVSVPVIADCDTGFGGVANVRRTVRAYERAGAAGLHIEDQLFPKRCGHFDGKSVVPAREMEYRLQAALDARTDPDFLIIARTDARAVEGFDAALERARRYLQLGADAIFFEQPRSVDELQRVGEAFRGTVLVANMVERSKTPLLPADQLLGMGFQIILYANAALYLGAYAIRRGLAVLRSAGTTESLLDVMMTFGERQALIGLDRADAYERSLVERVDRLSS
ncbi:isocitrate lyase/phosphoenolpyruvate mutase family protein [Paralcaligenes sp. KSB-10]|uniref:isocitrate lyase/PEP mutase family protein n=1 Tax=Paralcaligenes sp. KSB-10 TaxID=2901142 RepID=UPI001E6144AB|nr:isocitrate lyase/phosphoenolpyruvate mutase family protein [Paralcaligenes sp. KSB-10]UHL63898.1 isocitrate lyase/phosphoenolpyruvate mutase family protein [Paralcaligenes sp. KSB-10]